MKTGKPNDGLVSCAIVGWVAYNWHNGIFAGMVAGSATIVDGGIRVAIALLTIALFLAVVPLILAIVVPLVLVTPAVPLILVATVYAQVAGRHSETMRRIECGA